MMIFYSLLCNSLTCVCFYFLTLISDFQKSFKNSVLSQEDRCGRDGAAGPGASAEGASGPGPG